MPEIVILKKRVWNQMVDVSLPTFGHCPLCRRGYIYESSDKAYGCTEFLAKDKGCQLTIWKEYCGMAITEDILRQLLSGEHTGWIDGFSSRDGSRQFKARLMFHDGKVSFYREHEQEEGVCSQT